MRKLLIIVVNVIFWLNAFSQKETADLGVFVGSGTPLGDYTKTYRLQSIGLNYGAFYRYNIDTRLSVRINVLNGTIKGNGEMNSALAFPFQKNVTEVSSLFEINYLDFFMVKENKRFSPFIFAGIGLAYYTGPLDVAVISPSMPMGFGAKYALSKRWGVGAEVSIHKLFDDRLDNLNDPYKPTGMEPASSFWHNNDWLVYGGFTLWYRFYVGKRDCPAYENLNE
jgi:hypothetical protein